MAGSNSVFDYSMFGGVNSSGEYDVLEGRDALANAVRMWLVSFQGEIIRNLRRGGYVVRWLSKPMSENIRDRIREAIVDGIAEDFEPALTLTKLVVTPDYARRTWTIEMEGYSDAIKDSFSLTETLRSQG